MTDPYKGTTLMYCDILGEPELHFAWIPRKCFDGRWVWLRPVWARLCVAKPSLSWGLFEERPWWQYARVEAGK